MLDWNKILRYVKGRCSLPSGYIEKNDEEIKEWILENSLETFSRYYPDVTTTGIDVGKPEHIYYKRDKCYLIKDEEDLPIYGIKECYFPSQNHFIEGHPTTGVWQFSDMKWWSLETFKSRFFHKYSRFNYTYDFIHPNIVRIPTNMQPQNFVVEYERRHPEDLRTIPAAHENIFKDLALADIKLLIGEIRMQYSEIQTPIGTIPINGQAIYDQGERLKENLIQKIEDDYKPMSFIVDID
jgi:hypothetical protein